MNREERTAAAREAIQEATNKGFMNCKSIVRALYPERFPDRPVRWEAAYRWLADAGVVVVYLAPDGDTDVSKAERTGCWAADFPPVLARKEAYYQQIALNDWTRNVLGAVQSGISQEEAEEMMGPRPPPPAVFVDTAWKATGTKAKEAKVNTDTVDGSVWRIRDNRILNAMGSWSGPVTRKGKPKTGALSAVVGFAVTRERRNRLWAQVQQEKTA